MNLENVFCPNDDCPARGQVGKGNIHPHSQKEKRCRCTECNKTFVITKGTPFYRLRTDPQEVERRVVQGQTSMVERLIQATQAALGSINTSYIERINATFRQRLAPLARRSRHLAQKESTLQAGMWLVGCLYNFCDYHHSLRQQLSVGSYGHTWVQFTPAMAAGLSDHQWTAAELLTFKVPPSRWTPPKRRGRPSKETLERVKRWC